MQEYRKVIEFCYKNYNYVMYLNGKNKHYFLRKVNNTLLYPTLLELIDLANFFCDIPELLCIKKDNKKTKFIPKVIINGVTVTLTLSILSLGFSMYKSAERIKEFENNYDEHLAENYLAYNDDEIDEDLVVDTYLESDWLNYLYIYDMDYLDKYFNYPNVNIEQLKDVIENNANIPLKYKKLLFDYCNSVIKKYPNIELRVFYENLKSLEVVECSKEELITHTLSVDSYGCYVRTENKIYVLDGYEYEYKTWAYQVIFHEFSHALRTGYYIDGDKKVKIQVEGQNYSDTVTAEALNSLFTVSLFDYEEKDVAYQLQSNYHKVMIECMDNYSLEDYVQHSISYYAKKLDEFNNDDNYATVILNLIQVQYKDYHSNSISVDPCAYYPIYDYIAKMYFKKNITKDMSYEQALNICNKLVEIITYDVPEDYNIDVDYFYENLENYCNELGIKTNIKTR